MKIRKNTDYILGPNLRRLGATPLNVDLLVQWICLFPSVLAIFLIDLMTKMNQRLARKITQLHFRCKKCTSILSLFLY